MASAATMVLRLDGAKELERAFNALPVAIQRKALRVGDMFYDEELLYLDLPRPGDA